MKKADIKPGVVYAYQGSDNYSPVPVVFLSTDLHAERGRYSTNAAMLTKAAPHEKPGKDYLGRHTGYPAVFRGFDAEGTEAEVITSMLGATLEQAITDKLPKGVQSDVVTTLTRIRGPYDEAMAAYRAAQEADRERRRQTDEAMRVKRERAERVVATFKAAGVFSVYRGHLELSLENAEKLAALIPDHKPQPEEGNR
jgi:hypothetical protein